MLMMTCTPVSKCVTTLMDHIAAYALMAMNLALMDFHVAVRNAYFQLAMTYIIIANYGAILGYCLYVCSAPQEVSQMVVDVISDSSIQV